LLALIDAGSVAVSAGQVLGATRDVLSTIDRAAAHYRYRQRMGATTTLVAILPAWGRDMIRTDLARELPGSAAERLAVSDAEVDAFFAARHVRPVWSLDADPLDTSQAGGGMPLNGWPDELTIRLFSAASWLFLDGGNLDLGIVRDSALNATNEAEFFAETFEAAAFVGTESMTITAAVCADGTTSEAVPVDVCNSGS
jgi:hypothetical protein